MVLPDRSAQRESTLVVADQRLAAADRRNGRERGKELVAVGVNGLAIIASAAARSTGSVKSFESRLNISFPDSFR